LKEAEANNALFGISAILGFMVSYLFARPLEKS
jgi:hypothetical protein